MTREDLKLENVLTAETWGVSAQINQAMEEAAELIQALNKAKRAWLCAREPAEADIKEVHENVMEKMADVEIMLEQLKYLLYIRESAIDDIKQEKIKRSMIRREKMRRQGLWRNWEADARRKAANPYAGEREAERKWLREYVWHDRGGEKE